MGTTIPGMAFGEYAHGMPGLGEPGRVMWAIESGPDEGIGEPSTHHVFMKLIATLRAVTGGTEVTVDIEPASGDNPARIEAMDRDPPATAHMWRAIAAEQVDAVLTHRPFDMANIREAIAEAVVPHVLEIGKQMDDAAKEIQRREQEKIDRAYALDQQGR
jgi:hypothetical protein